MTENTPPKTLNLPKPNIPKSLLSSHSPVTRNDELECALEKNKGIIKISSNRERNNSTITTNSLDKTPPRRKSSLSHSHDSSNIQPTPAAVDDLNDANEYSITPTNTTKKTFSLLEKSESSLVGPAAFMSDSNRLGNKSSAGNLLDLKMRSSPLHTMPRIQTPQKASKLKIQQKQQESMMKVVMMAATPNGGNTTPQHNNQSKSNAKLNLTPKSHISTDFANELENVLVSQARMLNEKLEKSESERMEWQEKCHELEQQLDELEKTSKRRATQHGKSLELVWGLEVQNEELRNSLKESEQKIEKLTHDQKLFTQNVKSLKEQLEASKNIEHAAMAFTEECRVKYEDELGHQKKLIANLTKENKDLNAKLDNLEHEHVKFVKRYSKYGAGSPVKKAPSHSFMDESDKLYDELNLDKSKFAQENSNLLQQIEDREYVMSSAPIYLKANSTLDFELLKKSLIEAEQTIDNYQKECQQMKDEKEELDRILLEAHAQIQELQNVLEEKETMLQEQYFSIDSGAAVHNLSVDYSFHDSHVIEPCNEISFANVSPIRNKTLEMPLIDEMDVHGGAKRNLLQEFIDASILPEPDNSSPTTPEMIHEECQTYDYLVETSKVVLFENRDTQTEESLMENIAKVLGMEVNEDHLTPIEIAPVEPNIETIEERIEFTKIDTQDNTDIGSILTVSSESESMFDENTGAFELPKSDSNGTLHDLHHPNHRTSKRLSKKASITMSALNKNSLQNSTMNHEPEKMMETWASIAKQTPTGKEFEVYYFNEATQSWEKRPSGHDHFKSHSQATTSSQYSRDFKPVEALAHTMIGSWFQKYNRYGKNPKLRFFWVNPYSRSLSWSSKPPAQNRRGTNVKTVYIENLYWEEPVLPIPRVFPPSPEFKIQIKTSRRMISMVPTSWSDFDKWTAGLTLLLQQSVADLQEQCKEFNTSHQCEKEGFETDHENSQTKLSRLQKSSPMKTRQTLHQVTSTVAGLQMSPSKSPHKQKPSKTRLSDEVVDRSILVTTDS